MIINIRGTSGAGKSHIVYGLMDLSGATEPIMYGGKVIGYTLFKGKVAVVGRYETACGGCDTIKTQNEVTARVSMLRLYHEHVIFEGLLVSQIYQRYADFAASTAQAGDQYLWAQLDTPLQTCIDRVMSRRAAAGNTKPFDPDNSLTPKWHSCQTNFLKAERDGLKPVWLRHQNPIMQLLPYIRP